MIVAAEIAALWRVSDRTIQRQIDDAASLVEQFPATFAALASGELSVGHARIIVASGNIIERPELRAEFEASVLDYAKSESASRLAPIAKLRAEWFSEVTLDERHSRARAQRRVWATDLEDGLAELHCVGPAAQVYGARDRLTRLAHAVIAAREPSDASGGDDAPGSRDGADAAAGDTRTLDELRADILADLLLATDPVATTSDRPDSRRSMPRCRSLFRCSGSSTTVCATRSRYQCSTAGPPSILRLRGCSRRTRRASIAS